MAFRCLILRLNRLSVPVSLLQIIWISSAVPLATAVLFRTCLPPCHLQPNSTIRLDSFGLAAAFSAHFD